MKTTQNQRLLELLKDGLPHSTIEILQKVYGGGHLGIARIAGRIYDLKKKGFDIRGFDDKNHKTIYWYQLVMPGEQMSLINSLKIEPKQKSNNQMNFR